MNEIGLEAATGYAQAVNTGHGIRRTNKDKRECVERVLKEHPDWSNVRIAQACAVGHTLADTVRKEMFPWAGIPQVVAGRGGKRYTVTAKVIAKGKPRQMRVKRAA